MDLAEIVCSSAYYWFCQWRNFVWNLCWIF